MSMLHLAQYDEQQALDWLDGSVLRILLDSAATGGRLMLGRFDVALGEAPPEHVHRNEDEIFLLISGTAKVWFDGVESELGEGGVVFLPRGVPHAYRITSERADLLVINTPGGIEGMFREIGHDRAEPAPPGGVVVTPDPAISEKYGSTVVGPPR